MDLIEKMYVYEIEHQKGDITPEQLEALIKYRNADLDREKMVMNEKTEKRKALVEVFKAVLTAAGTAATLGISYKMLGEATKVELTNTYTSSMGKGAIKNAIDNLKTKLPKW